MGYGDDLLITSLAAQIKKKYPDRQIVIGIAKKNYAYHSPIYENNPNISDCRNLDNKKPIHIIDYHEYNRPYIDYTRTTDEKYAWKKFKPIPGELFFSDKEKLEAKNIILQAKDYWKNNHKKNYKKIIFLETSSTKNASSQFSIKQQNKDWGHENWKELVKKIENDYLIIQSIHKGTKNFPGVFEAKKMDFRLACAVLNLSDFYVGIEGGFGQVAAALGKKGVIYFGGWISPDVIGYDFHENVYFQDKLSPCGEYKKICNHCEEARKKITVDMLLQKIYKITEY